MTCGLGRVVFDWCYGGIPIFLLSEWDSHRAVMEGRFYGKTFLKCYFDEAVLEQFSRE